MAEGGDRRPPVPFRARVELEPPAGVCGDPIGSLVSYGVLTKVTM